MGIVGPGTPYVTPEMLRSAPTGISWGTIPKRDATASAQRAEMLNMCQRATSAVDTQCNQVIRATIDTEQLTGPDFRITVPTGSGVARIMLSRWPVLYVTGGQIAPTNQFPRSWTSIPANMFDVATPIIGIYGTNSPSDAGDGGNAVLLAPGIINWANGRNGCTLRTTYVNGWPHAGLTADVVAGATSILVDDCTGWGPVEVNGQGATGSIRDGENQETVTCVSTSVTSGPGTIELATPLVNDHSSGVVVTTIPGNIEWATILYASAQALTRGATSTGVQSVSPGPTGGSTGAQALRDHADKLCRAYARVI